MITEMIKEQVNEYKQNQNTGDFQAVLRNPLYRPLMQAGIINYIMNGGTLTPPAPVKLEGYLFTCNMITLQDLEVIEKTPYPELLEMITLNLGGLTALVSKDIHTKYKVQKPNSTVNEPLGEVELLNLFTNPGNILYLKSHYLASVLYNFFSLGS